MTTSPTRIGFLVKTYPRLSETFILNEILGLEQLGWDLHIYSLKRPVDEPVHPDVASVKAPVSYMPALLAASSYREPLQILMDHMHLLFTRPVRYASAFKRYFVDTAETRVKEFLQAGCLAVSLERKNITHLHAHFANTPTAVAEIVHWLTGIPFSFTAHAKDIYTSHAVDLTRRIRAATSVLTCTGFNESHLRALAGEGASIHLAYHGIDTKRFAAIVRDSPGNTAGEVPMVLSVGRFCEKKGLDDLIRACAILRDWKIKFRCVLVGYGPLEGQLKELRHALGLESLVEMPGRLAQPQVIEQYRRASVFALPCKVTDQGDRDGIPNVLFEAMAAGVPVVTTSVSGITELVVERETGWLVEPRNPAMLAESIEYVLAHPDKAVQLAKNAKLCVLQRFNLEVSARHVHEKLTAAVKQGHIGRHKPAIMKNAYREPNA